MDEVASPPGTESAGRLRRFVIGTLIGLVASLGSAQFAVQGASWDARCYTRNNCDGLTFTIAAELLTGGRTPYREDIRRDHLSRTRLSGASPPFDLPFQYPPNALPLFAIRALAPPAAAHVAVALLTTMVGLLLLWRLICRDLCVDHRAITLMAGVSFSGAVALNAELGQTGLIAAALVLGVTLSWHRAPVLAGILLGMLGFKPQYAIPLALLALLRTDWRILPGAIGAVVISTLASGLWFGFDQWKWFFGAVNEPNHTLPWMVNWTALAERLSPFGQDLIQRTRLPVFVVGTMALAAILWPLRHRTALEGQVAVVVAWAVLISPNTHPYDLLVLTPALVYVMQQALMPRMGAVVFVLSWCTLPEPFRWLMVLTVVALAVICTALLYREQSSQSEALKPFSRLNRDALSTRRDECAPTC